MPGMQPVARFELNEEGHRRPNEMRTRRPRVFSRIDIGLHHVAVVTDVVAIQTGAMLFVFADDSETTRGRVVTLAPSGNTGLGYFFSSPE